MVTTAPPSIVVNDPSTHNSQSHKPAPPTLDTSSASTSGTPTQATYNNNAGSSPTSSTSPLAPLLKRTNSLTTTPSSSASCYLCDEQNPGDFSPTTKHLDSCVLCSRYFCPIHHSPSHPNTAICNINHSTYYHEMLMLAKKLLSSSSSEQNLPLSPSDELLQEDTLPQNPPISPVTGAKLEGRGLAELLIQEGIYPSLGEREKAIFVTSPVDEQTVRELGAWRSLDAAVANGGVRGEKGVVEEREVVGADIAV